jgi:hypothetical protein
MTKLTIWHGTEKPIVAIGKNQRNLLAFAEKYRGWHTFAQDRATILRYNSVARERLYTGRK